MFLYHIEDPRKSNSIFIWNQRTGILRLPNGQTASIDYGKVIGKALFRLLEFYMVDSEGAPINEDTQFNVSKDWGDEIPFRTHLSKIFDKMGIPAHQRPLFVQTAKGQGYRWLTHLKKQRINGDWYERAKDQGTWTPCSLPDVKGTPKPVEDTDQNPWVEKLARLKAKPHWSTRLRPLLQALFIAEGPLAVPVLRDRSGIDATDEALTDLVLTDLIGFALLQINREQNFQEAVVLHSDSDLTAALSNDVELSEQRSLAYKRYIDQMFEDVELAGQALNLPKF